VEEEEEAGEEDEVEEEVVVVEKEALPSSPPPSLSISIGATTSLPSLLSPDIAVVSSLDAATAVTTNLL
jgi:hypothetical protein